MKLINNISIAVAMAMLSTPLFAHAQIKNAKTETVSIEGNSPNCKKMIEAAANKKGVAQVNWNAQTKKATLTYNSKTTTKEAVLKRVALAGFDNDAYNAPAEAYMALSKECQYKGTMHAVNHGPKEGMDHSKMDHSKMNPGNHQAAKNNTVAASVAATSKLEPLYNAYFAINNALVQTDAKTANQKSGAFASMVKTVKMGELTEAEHNVWMNVMKDLTKQADALKAATGIEKQRAAFAPLSQTMYTLMKSSKSPYKVYYNHCPMYNGGANWLSKEEGIKNPYFGSGMLTCGFTKETIQ